MNELINYFIEANAGLVFFYLIYWAALRNENQFSLNRIYLLSSLMASLLFPFITIGTDTPFIPSLSKAVSATWLPEAIVYSNGIASSTNNNLTSYNWSWISHLYIFIAAILFILFMVRIASLVKLFKHSQRYTWKTYTIVESNEIKGIFSFFNFIFFNPVHPLNEADKQEILRHEEVHIQRLHSLDIILIQMIGILFWFNPIVRSYKKSFVQLHEFEADARSVEEHEVDRYCHLLAKVALHNNGYVLANHFTNSFTLKRITMMKTIKTKIKNWKIMMLGVTLMLFFLAVSCQDQIKNELESSSITQVADYPAVVKTDIAKWENKFPGSKFNYLEGPSDEVKKKLDTFSGTVAILNTYPYPEKGLIGILTRDISKFDLKDDNEVFTIVEESARPKEGIEAYYQKLSSQLIYPDDAKKKGIEGKVYVEFVVDTDGTVLDPHVLKGDYESLNNEAVRVVGLSNAWVPGKQRGKAVKQRMVLPIAFKLNEQGEKSFSFYTIIEGKGQKMRVTGNKIAIDGEQYMVGQVFNEEGKPTAGMNIVLEGTNNGTVSDRDGSYHLKLSGSNGRVVFSFVGYETRYISF